MSWNQYNQSLTRYPSLGFSIDLSMMDISEQFHNSMAAKIQRAFDDMKALEQGGIANPDEERMVGHYWLRNPALAPNNELKRAIEEPIQDLLEFSKNVHAGVIRAQDGSVFKQILLIGIGGSALGPQLVTDAIGKQATLPILFFDNTDPAGIDAVVEQASIIGLNKTITLVISKSGGTAETRNGMLEAKAAYEAAGLKFHLHAVAITGSGSKMDEYAKQQEFIKIFPMEDWIGGRTSVLSTVGLVPAALQGLDVQAMLNGAKAMDELTRQTNWKENAAMQMALAWYHGTNGKGEKDMVVLPYKDALVLMSKYLQQLIMESLGKEKDLDGNIVNQGISVYGNKGSTDQHAYVQQLRDGVKNFFAVFIEVRKARNGNSIEVDPGNTSGDYLQGFLRGTRKALYASGRNSITISLEAVTPFSLGMLIALFERTVSFYASMIHINAYHQPGVEAGKKAASLFLKTLNQVRGHLTADAKTADQIASEINEDTEDVYHCLNHLAANGEVQISMGANAQEDSFQL